MLKSRNQIGKYRLVAEIARGGMGIVYLAVSHGPGGFNKLLVVKELRPQLLEDPGFLEMFFEEARLAARLTHPNIVQTYEIGKEGKRHFIVMDYLNGRSLSRVLRRKPDALTRGMHLRILCEVLKGLDYAHTLTDFDGSAIGVVHRDVNPQNVFITFDGQIKLVDFGIAKSSDSRLETRTGLLKGKPGYMAPEQLSGIVDLRCDIFAVGAMIWEAIAHKRLWSGKTDLEILSALMQRRLPSLQEVAPDTPQDLVRICDKAMAPDPDARYQKASELLDELEAYLVEAHEATTVREVAAVVSDVFADDHAQTRSAIDRCLAEVRAGEVRMSLPSLPMVAQEGATTHTAPASESTSPSKTAPTPGGTVTPDTAAPVTGRGRAWPLPAAVGALGIITLGWFVWPRSPAPPSAAPADASLASSEPGAGVPATPVQPPEVELAPPAATTAASASSAPRAARVPRAPRSTPPKAAAPDPPPAPAPAAAPASTCNPPFYFEGTKKVYKPGCL